MVSRMFFSLRLYICWFTWSSTDVAFSSSNKGSLSFSFLLRSRLDEILSVSASQRLFHLPGYFFRLHVERSLASAACTLDLIEVTESLTGTHQENATTDWPHCVCVWGKRSEKKRCEWHKRCYYDASVHSTTCHSMARVDPTRSCLPRQPSLSLAPSFAVNGCAEIRTTRATTREEKNHRNLFSVRGSLLLSLLSSPLSSFLLIERNRSMRRRKKRTSKPLDGQRIKNSQLHTQRHTGNTRSGTSSDRWVKIVQWTGLSSSSSPHLSLFHSFSLSPADQRLSLVTRQNIHHPSSSACFQVNCPFLRSLMHASVCLCVCVCMCLGICSIIHLLSLSLYPSSPLLALSPVSPYPPGSLACLTIVNHRHDTTIHFSCPHERRVILCILLSSSFFSLFLSSSSSHPAPLLVRLCIFPSFHCTTLSFLFTLSLSFFLSLQSVYELIAQADFRDHEDDLHSDHIHTTLHYHCCILSLCYFFFLSLAHTHTHSQSHSHISLTSYSPVDALSRSSFHSPSHANAVWVIVDIARCSRTHKKEPRARLAAACSLKMRHSLSHDELNRLTSPRLTLEWVWFDWKKSFKFTLLAKLPCDSEKSKEKVSGKRRKKKKYPNEETVLERKCKIDENSERYREQWKIERKTRSIWNDETLLSILSHHSCPFYWKRKGCLIKRPSIRSKFRGHSCECAELV